MFGYFGYGLNNFFLWARGKYDLDVIATAFVSNGWLLFAYDFGIVYGVLMIVLAIAVLLKGIRHSPDILIFLLPVYFLVAADNLYAVYFEMHSLFWILLGIACLLINANIQERSQLDRSL